jgi:zinc transport system ATP-binding protein
MTANAVEIKNLSLELNGLPILHDINLSLKKRDFMALIGPNGGGKSTLLKIILGLITPDKGQVKIFGKSPLKARKLMGYLPQHIPFDPDFPINVFETVLMGRYKGLFKNYSKKDEKAVENALREVEMLELRERQLSKLSGGQIQRVFIARAISREPELLLLDEPMASIDPEMQNLFYELLGKLKEKMTIILVSHDVGAVASYADSIACLNRRLFYHGPVEDSAEGLEEVYNCPIDLISHGIPHRILKKH